MAHLLCELQAVHAFHAEVCNQDIEVLLVEFLQRVAGVIGADCPIALHLQDLAAQARQNLMIIDEKYRFHFAGSFSINSCPSAMLPIIPGRAYQHLHNISGVNPGLG